MASLKQMRARVRERWMQDAKDRLGDNFHEGGFDVDFDLVFSGLEDIEDEYERLFGGGLQRDPDTDGDEGEPWDPDDASTFPEGIFDELLR